MAEIDEDAEEPPQNVLPDGHTHAPDPLQVRPPEQVPQLPPQPSSPHVRPEQSGVHARPV